MVVWRRSHRQWKRAVAEAVSPVRFAGERDRLATNIARRIWLANGGRAWADRRSEGTLLLLESLVASSLTDDVVRASLALEYLSLLETTARRADYEDAGAVRAEFEWSTRALEAAVESVLRPPFQPPMHREQTVNLDGQLGQLHTAVTDGVVAKLRSGGLMDLSGLAA